MIDRSLFPAVELALEEPLTDALKRVVSTLEIVRIEDHVPPSMQQILGRPMCNRACIARAFVAKAVLDIRTTNDLREMLCRDQALRRICGFELKRSIPSKSTLSRAFTAFAQSGLGQRTHVALTDTHVADKVVMHSSRDATAIIAREKPNRKPAVKNTEKPPRQKPGPKRKGDPPRELTRLEKQRKQTAEEAFAELPVLCDFGVKKDSKGKRHHWVGYKEHIDWTDNGYPLNLKITSASVHDSQVAIPLAKYAASKWTILYELMDAAYDTNDIIAAITELGHRPIIAISDRRTTAVPFDEPTERRYNMRSSAERGNARLKDEFGCRHVRVRGAPKVHLHVMFGVLALCADVLVKMATSTA